MQPAPLQAVILAGGSGTRFWPRSRRALPKQFLRIGGKRTLLRETYDRLLPLAGLQAVTVVTGKEHVERAGRELPELPPGGLLGEPVARDTAACVGLAAEWLHARDPSTDPVMLVCPSDHLIHPQERFREAVEQAAGLAAEGHLVTLGIPPRGPSTAFGYIQRGGALNVPGPCAAYRVERFVEKPDHARAEAFLRQGGHYWNSGLFLWRVSAIRAAIRRFFPELGTGLEALGGALARSSIAAEALEKGFPRLPRASIDRGVLEGAAAAGLVEVVEAPFEWDDVGSWNALERYLPPDGQGNHVEGRHVGLDTRGCLISGTGRRLIATIGLKDLIVVESDDAILICARDEAEKVKELVTRLEARGEAERA